MKRNHIQKIMDDVKKVVTHYRKQGHAVMESTKIIATRQNVVPDLDKPLENFLTSSNNLPVSDESTPLPNPSYVTGKEAVKNQYLADQKERVEARMAKDTENYNVEKQIASQPADIQVLIGEYRNSLNLHDLSQGEDHIRVRCRFIAAERSYKKDLNDIQKKRNEVHAANRDRDRLFTKNRVSDAQVYHIAKADGYFLATDNGRTFIKSDATNAANWSALVKAKDGDDSIGHQNVFMALGAGTTRELSTSDFAEILEKKPAYSELVKAYRLGINNSLSFSKTSDAKKVW